MRIVIVALALAACSPPAEKGADAPPAAEGATVAPTRDLAQVASPTAEAAVTSPLHVTGVAPANWYFENQFPVQLVDAQGNVLAQAPAAPRVNWTENAEPKEFDATLAFTATGPATLVLQEDMPGEGATPREVRVPVTLTR